MQLPSDRSTRDLCRLLRFAYTPHGTFGRIVLPNGRELYTVEDPPNENRVGQSCIPEGRYRCVPRRFNRGGYDAVHITGVPGRSLCLFHVANTTHDVSGCVGVARRLGFYRGRWAVLDSRGGFREFMAVYGGRNFETEITSFRPDVITEGDDAFRRVLAAASVEAAPVGDPVVLPSETSPRVA